jgi:hypothetical protein
MKTTTKENVEEDTKSVRNDNGDESELINIMIE